MNNFIKFFNYNWFKIVKNNIKNNKYNKVKTNDVCSLVIKKELCAIIFVILHFLIIYSSSIEMYKMTHKHFIFFHILKDNFFTSFTWFTLLSILPIISIILFKKKIKNKYYLILDILYLLSNAFNILMVVYFITCFINNFLLSLLGLINIVITVIINSNIIIKINEKYLIH